MATSISKQRLYRKYSGFPKAYRIIHLETSTDVVVRGDGETTLEDTLSTMEEAVAAVANHFDENGILKPEYGGSGGDKLPELIQNASTSMKPAESPKELTKDGQLSIVVPGAGEDGKDTIVSVTMEHLAKYLSTLIFNDKETEILLPVLETDPASPKAGQVWIKRQ